MIPSQVLLLRRLATALCVVVFVAYVMMNVVAIVRDHTHHGELATVGRLVVAALGVLTSVGVLGGFIFFYGSDIARLVRRAGRAQSRRTRS
jgi:hypothetical protein